MTDKASKLSVKGIETKAVQAYLAQYPFLKAVLEEAEEQVARFFGEDAEIVYRVVHDPEIANWVLLFGDIWMDLTVSEAMDKFEDFDYKWYLKLPSEVKDILEFQMRPRRL
jgi:hypothetical protein